MTSDVVFNGLRNKRVLVTGGYGFLGNHLCDALYEAGADLYVMRYNADPSRPPKLTYLSGWWKRARTIDGDLRDYQDAERAIAIAEPEYVFHLAAMSQVTECANIPAQAYAVTVMGTVHLLDALRRLRPNTPVIISSSDKAVGFHEQPISSWTPYRAIHPYEASKAAQEIVAKSYAIQWDMPIGIIRAGNLFGGGDLNFKRIIPTVFRAILDKEPVIFRTDGEQVREYIYAGSAIVPFARMARLLEMGKIAPGQVVTLGGYEATANEVYELASRAMLGGEVYPSVVRLGGNAGENPMLRIDNKEAERLLGWEYNRLHITSHLKITADWYRKFWHPGGSYV
jgi:CDP-glucose 4,6-dehydratase